jgi:hypothetical protein
MSCSLFTITLTPRIYSNEDCFRELASHDSRCPCCKKTAETHERMKPTWDASEFGCCLICTYSFGCTVSDANTLLNSYSGHGNSIAAGTSRIGQGRNN